MAEVSTSDVWFLAVVLIFIPLTGTSVTWTAPPPAWTQTDPNDIRTVDMPVRNGSTQVALRWTYTLSPGSVLQITEFAINTGSSDDIGRIISGAVAVFDRHDYRTRFNISSTNQVATLIINKVTEREEAVYECELGTSSGTWRYRIRVIVTVPVNLTNMSGDQTLHEGSNMTLLCKATDAAKIVKLASENIVAAQQSVSLHCQAEGNPQPTYSWTPCEPQKRLCHENMLNISEVLNDGDYTCKVANVLGNDARNTSIVIASDVINVTLVIKSEKCTDGRYKQPLLWRKLNETTGTVVKSFGKYGAGKGEFKKPIDASLDDEGRIVVTECGNHRIHLLSKEGETISIFGDSGPEKLNRPTSCIPYKNMFLVSDEGNSCIKVYDQSGTFLYKFGTQGNQEGQFNLSYGMLVDRYSNLLVCDWNNNRVQQFTLDGRFTGKTLTHLPDPFGIATAPDGRILVTSFTANKVFILK